MEGNILNEINQRNRSKFDELFPPNYIVLGGNIFNETNQRNKRKLEELFPPFIIFWEELDSMKQTKEIGINFISYFLPII